MRVEAAAIVEQSETAWFEEAVRKHYRLVFAVCYQQLGRRTEAEDAAQEAFLKAYRSRESLRDRGAVAAWLGRIARNCALDVLRRRRRSEKIREDGVDPAEAADPTPPAALEVDTRERLRQAVKELPEPESLVVTMRFLEGLGCNDIAERLGEKPGTVRVRLHRAIAKLRKTLTKEGEL